MTQDEIIEMAKEAGWPDSLVAPIIMAKLHDFAKLVAKKEEEETMKAFCKMVIADYKQKIEDLENMLQNFRGVNNDTR